jgi:hypothetical protein
VQAIAVTDTGRVSGRRNMSFWGSSSSDDVAASAGPSASAGHVAGAGTVTVPSGTMPKEAPLLLGTESWSKVLAEILDDHREQRVERGFVRPMCYASTCTGMATELLGLEV